MNVPMSMFLLHRYNYALIGCGANAIALSTRYVMVRHIMVRDAARSQSGESASPWPSARRISRAKRPETALEGLLERWIAAGLPRGLGLLGLWLRRLRHRDELANLGEAQLRDVGLDAHLVRHESRKPFWMA